jgi:hypothetical protein
MIDKKCEYCNALLVEKNTKRKFRRDKKFCSQKCHDKHKYENFSQTQKNFKDEHGLNLYTLKGIKKKLQLIELMGGKCEKCGYDKNIAAFDFHHKNPFEKSFDVKIQKLNYMSDDDILNEAMKCMLLCANCHRELHSPYMEINHVKRVVALQKEISK